MNNTKSKTKVKVIIIVVIALLLIASGVVAYIILSNPIRNFTNSIQSGDYETALEIYEDKLSDSSKDTNEVSSILIDDVNLKYNDYLNETISKDDIIDILKTIIEFDIEKVNKVVSDTNTSLKEISTGRDNFALAEEEFNNKNWQDAITYYSSVSKDDSIYYSKAQNQITACTDNYKTDIQEEYQKYIDTGDYESATQLIETALTYLPNDNDLKSLLDNIGTAQFEAELQTIKEQASQYELDNDLLDAYILIDNAIAELGSNNEELNTLLQDYKEKYINSIIAQSEEYIAINDYQDAQSVLEDAISQIGQEDVLMEKLQDIKDNTPISLSSMKAVNQDGYQVCSYDMEDTFGNVYTNNVVQLNSKWIEKSSKVTSSYAEFYLDKKCSKFIATVGVSDGSSDDQEGVIEIYADDKLIYTSTTLNRSTKPFNVELDVSNVEWFKILLKPKKLEDDNGAMTPSTIIGNAVFTVSPSKDTIETTTQSDTETVIKTDITTQPDTKKDDTSKKSESN